MSISGPGRMNDARKGDGVRASEWNRLLRRQDFGTSGGSGVRVSKLGGTTMVSQNGRVGRPRTKAGTGLSFMYYMDEGDDYLVCYKLDANGDPIIDTDTEEVKEFKVAKPYALQRNLFDELRWVDLGEAPPYHYTYFADRAAPHQQGIGLRYQYSRESERMAIDIDNRTQIQRITPYYLRDEQLLVAEIGVTVFEWTGTLGEFTELSLSYMDVNTLGRQWTAALTRLIPDSYIEPPGP